MLVPFRKAPDRTMDFRRMTEAPPRIWRGTDPSTGGSGPPRSGRSRSRRSASSGRLANRPAEGGRAEARAPSPTAGTH